VKKLITAQELKKQAGEGVKIVYLNKDMIITPSARDMAAELGIELRTGECAESSNNQTITDLAIQAIVKNQTKGERLSLSDDEINIIVQEVLKSINLTPNKDTLIKENDPSGIRLVRGGSVICEAFDTGNPKDKVGIKEVLNSRECPNMATGFMTFEKSAFDWMLGYDELDYIVEGDLDIIVNGKTYHGHQGDVFFIPMGTSITFSVPNYCKFFFSTYPVNWQELSGEKSNQ
jgi:ethanolamine utilization protein EutQ